MVGVVAFPSIKLSLAELSSLKKHAASRQVNPEYGRMSVSTEVERQYAYASFNAMVPDVPHYVPPGRGHLSLILLSELAFEQSEHFKPHLAVVLHQAFLGLDYSLHSYVPEHCRVLLLNLVNALGVKPADLELSGNDESAADLVEFLRTKENKQLWAHEVRYSSFIDWITTLKSSHRTWR